MIHYLYFFIKCLKTRFKFFTYSPAKKARVLSKNNLHFLAGLYYLDLKKYPEATICFENCHAYKHLILAYQKQGLYSKAIEVADREKYYKQGAKLCIHIQNTKKAAYFYSYFNPLYAAKLYTKDGFFFEAGTSHLRAYDGLSAITSFDQCPHSFQKEEGYKLVEEFGLVLYLTKQYEEAFKIFIELKDYYSALDCAKKLREDDLIESVTLLIASYEAEQKHYLLAGKYIENIAPDKALYYYALGQAHYDMIRLLVLKKDYAKAINVCFLQNNLELAREIMNTYVPSALAL